MLIVYQVGPGVVDYFLDGRDRGQWSSGAGTLLGLEGAIEPADLNRVLRGLDPATGAQLQPSSPRRRRSGWDLIFSAPKSVSLLRAVASGDDGDCPGPVETAHRDAVRDVMRHVERTLTDTGARPARALISAAFDHLENRAGEPHLHSHVLVANLAGTADGWRAVDPGPWHHGRRALSALYDLSLRHHLAVAGFDLDWRLRPDGFADLAYVPRTAIRAASSRGGAIRTLGPVEARRQAAPQPWREKALAAGLPPPPPALPPREAAGLTLPSADAARLERAVTTRLGARRSDFRREDVIVALAACHAGGATTDVALAWADTFCRASIEVASPTVRPRWTTGLARGADDALLATLARLGPSAAVGSALAQQVAAACELTPEQARQVEALTADDRPVAFVRGEPGRSGFVDRAELLDACRAVWTEAGLSMTVISGDAVAEKRWETLAGLASVQAGPLADIIIVDGADRRTTPELIGLATRAADRAGRASPGPKLVFLDGGTRPCLSSPASAGLVEAAVKEGRLPCPPARPWTVASDTDERQPPRLVGRSAAEAVLRAWTLAPGSVMVGLGVDEVEALNRAAARPARGPVSPHPTGLGLPTGPDSTSPGLPTSPDAAVALDVPPGRAPGDRVVVLRHLPGLPPYGTFGTVTSADRTRGGTFEVAWEGSNDTVRFPTATHAIGPGWAVTRSMAAHLDRPAMVLGPESALARRIGQVLPSLEPEPRDRQPAGRLVER